MQLLEVCLERCDRLEPKLNAFTMLDRDGATAAAREATERQKTGRRRGPLDGMPVAIKDNLYVAGLPAGEWRSVTTTETADWEEHTGVDVTAPLALHARSFVTLVREKDATRR